MVLSWAKRPDIEESTHGDAPISVQTRDDNHQNGKPEPAGEHADKSSTNSPISAVPEFFQRRRGRSIIELRRALRLPIVSPSSRF
jgi:hypothetical protein